MKKKYTILGNCQVDALSTNLHKFSDFDDKFTYLKIPPVHTIKNPHSEALSKILKEVDLLITQPIKDSNRFGILVTEKIMSFLKKDVKVISLPSMHYSGYFPTFGTMPGVKTALNNVHDYSIVAAYLANIDISTVIRRLESTDDFILSRSQIINSHNGALASLRLREQESAVDVEVSSYISENYKSMRLFHQFNHPNDDVVGFICYAINNILDLKVPMKVVFEDCLCGVDAPIYPAVIQSLELEFKADKVQNFGVEVNLSDFVISSYEAYRHLCKRELYDMLKLKKKVLLSNFELSDDMFM